MGWTFWKRNRRGETRKSRLTRAASSGPGKRARTFQIPAHAVLIGVLFIAATSAVIIGSGQVMPWRVGQRPTHDIAVRQPFRVLDPEATIAAKEEAKLSTPNYYRLNETLLSQIGREFGGLYNDLKSADEYAKLTPEAGQRLRETWGIDQVKFDALRKILGEMTPERGQEQWTRLRAAIGDSNIIEQMPEAYQKVGPIELIDPTTKTTRRAQGRTFVENASEVQQQVDKWVGPFADPLNVVIRDYLLGLFKQGQAVWLFDQQETESHRTERYKAKENERFREYKPGQVLVGRGEEITETDLPLLEREHQTWWTSLGGETKLLANAGIVTLVSLITLVIGVYGGKFEPRAIATWGRSLALAVTLFLMVGLAEAVSLGGLSAYTAVFEVVLAALVLTVAYNQRFSLMMTVALTSLILLALRGELGLLLALVAGGFSVALILDEVRSRSKLIEVAVAGALMSFAVVWTYQMVIHQDVRYSLLLALGAGAAAFLGVFMFSGTLPLIERLFEIATSMTLLELCDASNPLLRRMALEIPGTFHHSLLLGQMAESAAEAIGANGLLARVGAYYHDIGKLSKPEYFVENQPGRNLTRHKGLSPVMSLLIIIGHVRDGLELAKEYALPKVLLPFIGEHHGTTLVEYFYHLSSQQRSEAGEPPLPDVEFRYPGPKPHTKETAILMMSDAAEARTRALAEPTIGRIEAQVHQIVKKRLEDDQLDECDLTLRELHVVEESLVKSLWAMYHGRVKYPSQEPMERPKEKKEQAAS